LKYCGKKLKYLKVIKMLELFESLKNALKAESGYEFELQDVTDEKTGISYKKLVRKYDLKSLPAMLRFSREFYYLYKNYICEDREIEWENDWRDPNPISVDYIEIWPDRVLIGTSGEFSTLFMTEKYHDLEVILDSEDALYMNREDKMKLARYVPALIKDVEVAIKIMAEVSTRNGFDPSEFKFFQLDDVGFCVKTEYSTVGMREEKIVENCMKRVKVISEWRRRFRTWLSSTERKQYYESTKGPLDVFKHERRRWVVTGGVGLVKWPVKDKNVREKIISHHIYRYLSHGAPIFTLDGYGIVGYRINHDYKFKFWVDRKQKKFRKLSLIPLEKIEFLKEDFPEMFK
jgi:hypothetical protein